MKNSILCARTAQGCTCSGEVRSRPARPFLVVRSWELKRGKPRSVAGDSSGGLPFPRGERRRRLRFRESRHRRLQGSVQRARLEAPDRAPPRPRGLSYGRSCPRPSLGGRALPPSQGAVRSCREPRHLSPLTPPYRHASRSAEASLSASYPATLSLQCYAWPMRQPLSSGVQRLALRALGLFAGLSCAYLARAECVTPREHWKLDLETLECFDESNQLISDCPHHRSDAFWAGPELIGGLRYEPMPRPTRVELDAFHWGMSWMKEEP